MVQSTACVRRARLPEIGPEPTWRSSFEMSTTLRRTHPNHCVHLHQTTGRWLTVFDVTGMLVAGAPGLERAPSEHFAAALVAAESPQLRRIVADLIDGHPVTPDGNRLDISARTARHDSAQLIALDLQPGLAFCFLITIWAREDCGTDGEWDRRGTPQLLDDVLSHAGRWELYNCRVTLQSWSRSAHVRGHYPGQ